METKRASLFVLSDALIRMVASWLDMASNRKMITCRRILKNLLLPASFPPTIKIFNYCRFETEQHTNHVFLANATKLSVVNCSNESKDQFCLHQYDFASRSRRMKRRGHALGFWRGLPCSLTSLTVTGFTVGFIQPCMLDTLVTLNWHDSIPDCPQGRTWAMSRAEEDEVQRLQVRVLNITFTQKNSVGDAIRCNSIIIRLPHLEELNIGWVHEHHGVPPAIGIVALFCVAKESRQDGPGSPRGFQALKQLNITTDIWVTESEMKLLLDECKAVFDEATSNLADAPFALRWTIRDKRTKSVLMQGQRGHIKQPTT